VFEGSEYVSEIGWPRQKARSCIRTIPVPAWVKQSVDSWSFRAGINQVHCCGPSIRQAEFGETALRLKWSGQLWRQTRKAVV